MCSPIDPKDLGRFVQSLVATQSPSCMPLISVLQIQPARLHAFMKLGHAYMHAANTLHTTYKHLHENVIQAGIIIIYVHNKLCYTCGT